MDVGIRFTDRVYKFMKAANGNLYAGTMTGLYFSTNGSSWFTYGGYIGQQVYDYTFDSKGNLLKATLDGVFRSSDDGMTWTKLNEGTNLGTVTCIVTDSKDHIYAGTQQGIYASVDDGSTWDNISQTDSLKNAYFVRLVYHGNYIYAATNYGVYVYDIFYRYWAKAQTGMGSQYVTDLIRRDNGDFYATTFNGIYYSSDSCAFWQPVDIGSASKNVNCVAFDPKGNMYFGTANNGVYTSKTSLTAVQQIPQKQTDFGLSVYPNPVHDLTTIRYTLPQSVELLPVVITVQDLSGKEITTLFQGEQKTGCYTISFRPQKQAPGVYFISLRAGNLQTMKKIVLVK